MGWYKRPSNVPRRGRLSPEIEREIAFHLAERTDDLMAQGMSKNDAMREARRRFGNPRLARERTHGPDVFMWFESVLADIRYAVRSLRRSPGFATVAILSLGLGIGANTAVFSLYNALVLRTLPVPNPEELVQVTFGDDRTSFTNPLWEELRDQQNILSSAFAFSTSNFDLASGGEERNARGYLVSGDFFRSLGVRPVLGRLLASGDDYRGCPAAAAVSYGFWQRELGATANAVGTSLTLNGTPFRVLGVVDPTFTGVDVGRAIDVYVPLCSLPLVGNDYLDMRSAWFLRVFGRPGGDLTAEQASARLAALSPNVFGATVPHLWDADAQERYRAYTFAAREAPNGVSSWRGRYRTALLVLLALVGAVLLIACANVANLLLARATRRQHEVAIRRAIGSSRARLVRLLVIESLLLSFVSAIVALVFARWASALLVGMLSSSQNVWFDLSLDGRVLGFTIAIATATGILFGLAPALRATAVAPQSALRMAGREIADRRGRFSMGKMLVVGQLALSLSLVVGAGLLTGTLTQLTTLDTGFNRDGVLLATVVNRNAGYSPEEARIANREILERIRALPGVQSASAARITPIGGPSWNNIIEVDGYEPLDDRDAIVWFNATSDSYFATLETPLLAGRDFDARDALGSVPVAVINESLAHKFFGAAQPLGKRFRTQAPGEEPVAYEVIGVVADTKYQTIDEENSPIVYFALNQESDDWGTLRYLARTSGPPTALISAVANTIVDVHPQITVRFSTLADNVAASLTRPRLLAVLSGFFGAVALLLAMIGLYGTLSYRVTSRRNEIGLRLALGAARGRVLAMVLGEVGRLVVVGIVLGVAVALASTRLLSAFLFGLTATDPTIVAVSAAVLATVALAAGALPAWRAARVDPMVALRED
jgi:putative ABC transport system permease protein